MARRRRCSRSCTARTSCAARARTPVCALCAACIRRSSRTASRPRITPDGPRGPRFKFKPGAIFAAQITGKPVVPIAFAAKPAWVLRTWDKFVIPSPFARVCIAIGEPYFPPAEIDDEQMAAAQREMERRMLETYRAGAKRRLTSASRSRDPLLLDAVLVHALFDFDLNRRVRDAEALGEQRLRVSQHDCVIGRGGHRRVHRQQRFLRTDQPGVHVMHVANRRDALLERAAQLARRPASPASLPSGCAPSGARAPRRCARSAAHTSSDSSGSIGSQPVHRMTSAASDGRHRAEQVAEHVQRRRGDVHVVRVAPPQHRKHDQIHDQAEAADPQDRRRIDRPPGRAGAARLRSRSTRR